MAILVLLNNFLHDFSAAGWLFCTVLLWWMFRREKVTELDAYRIGDGGKILAGVIHVIIVLMRISFFGIVVFGIVRALAYKQYEWSAAAGEGQVTLLIVKHVLLAFVFAVGVVFYRKAVKWIAEEQESEKGEKAINSM
jgi:lysylphosphatidylglycerol synthetase-like protein (DUF2156 family)